MNHMNQAAIARLDQLVCWLRQSDGATVRWLGKNSVVVAWLGLLLALISSPHGPGVMLCWFQHTTGLPCAGCGMTRSLSCAIRGMFHESWNYHPLGLLILPMFLVVAAQSVLPNRIRERLAWFIQSRPTLFNALYLAFLTAFVGFGIIRAFLHFNAALVKFQY